jgi:predicted dehydrogenase
MEIQKKYGKIIQGGTQNRSNPAMIEGVDYLRSGVLGEIQYLRTVFYKYRASMGKRRGPQKIPSSVDYDLFQGPAPMVPLSRNRLHYDWHWFWETGNGDMGNIGAHRVDNIRHAMGDDRQPSRVMSLGGRYLYDDDGQTPNVHLALMDYDGIPALSEIRNIPFKPGVRYMDHTRNVRDSCIVQCEGGYILLGDGASAYTNDGKRIRGFEGSGGVKEHLANFIDAVRNQNYNLLNCPVEYTVKAGEIFHMANLSFRSGFPTSQKEVSEAVGGITAAQEAVDKIRGNLERHSIDLSKDPLTMGSWMSLEDSGNTLKVQNPESDLVAQALFQKRAYREPYAVPDKI